MKKEALMIGDLEIIKEATFHICELVESEATDIGKSRFISLRDACTCTGNCPGRV